MVKKNLKNKTVNATSINHIFISIFAVVLIVGVFVSGASYVYQQQSHSNQSQQQAKKVAPLVAQQISQTVWGYAELVRRLSLDPQVIRWLRDGDFAQLEQLAVRLQKQSPYLLKIRFLPKEDNETDKDAKVPFTYASLDLVNRSEKSQGVLKAEIHSPNTNFQHIALASSVRDHNAQLVGFVHVAINPQAVFNLLETVQSDVASLLLEQKASANTIDLAKSPAFTERKDDDQHLKIDHTIWQLVYQSNHSDSLMDDLWITLMVLLGVIVVAVFVLLKKSHLVRALKNDQDWIIDIVEKKLSGSVKASLGNFSLAENKETMKYLAQLEGVTAAQVNKTTAPAEKAFPEDSESENSVNTPAFPSSVSQGEMFSAEVEESSEVDISLEIFKEYDIRGIVGDTLNLEHAYVIGKAIGSLAIERGEFNMLVARDGRVSSKDLSSTLVRGLVETGINVIDLGMVPTPLLYFGTHFLSAKSGVMVTGSHNPVSYNGFKIVIAGQPLTGDEIRALHTRIEKSQFSEGEGSSDAQDISEDYIQRIVEDVQLLRPLNIVLDCGNGVASVVAKPLFEALGCEVTTLYCDVDGQFPNHHPDPGDPKNMQDLVKAVNTEGADIGIAFDGDGDRLGVVDATGKIIFPDRLLMLLASDVLLRNPGADIIYDIKSSKNLAAHILSSGGRPIMWKSGHSLMKSKMQETGALLAGELSGHIFFKERWYGFDDALYVASRLLEVISSDDRSSDVIFSQIPDSINTPELHLAVPEGGQHEIMKHLLKASVSAFPNAKIIDIDGIRAEYPGAWGLVRASNTTPTLVFRFEADDQASLAKVQDIFRTVMKTVLPNAKIPF